jgi:hypothetical protein
MKTLFGKEFPAPKAVSPQRTAKMNYIIRTDGLMMMMMSESYPVPMGIRKVNDT